MAKKLVTGFCLAAEEIVFEHVNCQALNMFRTQKDLNIFDSLWSSDCVLLTKRFIFSFDF